jgi:hypothetical protein
MRMTVLMVMVVVGLRRWHARFRTSRGLYDEMDHHEAGVRHKQRKLYMEWEREVFNKIQEQVVEKVDSLDIFELERRKMKLYKEFMNAENRMVRRPRHAPCCCGPASQKRCFTATPPASVRAAARRHQTRRGGQR